MSKQQKNLAVVFADFDNGYGGQAAAYTLAHRLSGKVQAHVRLPKLPGDWNDVLQGRIAS